MSITLVGVVSELEFNENSTLNDGQKFLGVQKR